MPIHFTTGAQPETTVSTGGEDASGSVRPQPLASDNAAARKVRKKCEGAFMLGMFSTFSATSFAWMPFAIPFETNEPYGWIVGGFLVSITIVAAASNRLLTIISQAQDRENFAWQSIRSYDRQLGKARSRADETNRENSILRNVNAALFADRRRRPEGDADGDMGSTAPSATPPAWRVN